ncbi:Hypothetical predicted protein [Olea europaea subsp. europaea]|nr:Hypothetical predicted protein [Olea europaea subsp. europaea]
MVQLQNQFLENSPFVGDGAMVADELLEPAIQIITLGRRRISTHSRILAPASRMFHTTPFPSSCNFCILPSQFPILLAHYYFFHFLSLKKMVASGR